MPRPVLALAILALAAACLAGPGCTSGPATVITSPVTVLFWHSQSGAAAELLAQMAADFSLAEPNVTIRVTAKPAGSLAADLVAAAAAGEAPAMAEVPASAMAWLREMRVLQCLSPFAANPHYGLGPSDVGDFWPCFVEANVVGRQIWGLPFSHRVYALVYDKTRVSRAPATWDELRQTAAALTRRDHDPSESRFGLAFRPDADLFLLFLYQNGGALLSGDPPRCGFGAPTGVAAFDYLYELAFVRKAVLLTMGDPLDALTSSRAVMAIAPVGWPPVRPGSANLAVAPLPAGVARATLAPGTSLVMTTGQSAAAQEAAWRFMRWLVRPENAARWAAATGDVPVRRSALDKPVWRLGPGLDQGWQAVLGGMDTVVALPFFARWAEAEAWMTAGVRAYLLGEANSSQVVLDRLAGRIEAVLSGR